MRQRVALIRTLIVDPDILLLDEPFSALDYQTRLYLEGVLVDAVTTFKKTVILVTHDIDEVVALANKVVVLTKRPASAKAEHSIGIMEHDPLAARSDPRFSDYFHMLCSESRHTDPEEGRMRPSLPRQRNDDHVRRPRTALGVRDHEDKAPDNAQAHFRGNEWGSGARRDQWDIA